ncbi:MAG: hypothetical protein ACI3U2_01085, partial [Anaerovibrio sp.]
IENFVVRAPGTDILFLHSPQTVRFAPQSPFSAYAYFACCASKITAGQDTIYHSYAGKRSRFSCGKDGGSYPKKQSAPSRPLHNSVIITCHPILPCLNRYKRNDKTAYVACYHNATYSFTNKPEIGGLGADETCNYQPLHKRTAFHNNIMAFYDKLNFRKGIVLWKKDI